VTRLWHWDRMHWAWSALLLVALASTAVAANWSALDSLTGAEIVGHWPLALSSGLRLGSAPTGATPGSFTTEQFIGDDGQHMTYYLYVPDPYQPTTTYPIVLLLHGVGESAVAGNSPEQNRDVLIQQHYVQAWVASAAQAQYPCFVVVPQVPAGTRWVNAPGSDGSYTLATRPTVALTTAMDIAVTVEANYTNIDWHRLYIVGISMGADGLWDAIERWPWLFAAAAPLAGAGDPARAAAVAQLPIWDFQGGADTKGIIASSREVYEAIHAAGGSSCYTEFPGLGHDLWNTVQVYQNATFRKWLFSQTGVVRPWEQLMLCTSLSVDGVPAW
jgi:predicted peptidase